MFRTKATQTITLAGFAPADKPSYTNYSTPRSGLWWRECVLAAMGMAQAAPLPSGAAGGMR